MWALINACLQHVIPHHLLSRLVCQATRCTWRPWKNTLIRLFVRHYNVDISQAEKSSVRDYETFNDFFTRALKPGARSISRADGGIISPVDGSVSALGRIEDERLFQVKSKEYTLTELLNNDREQLRYFRNGCFITLYLSPRDYHRVHIPADGELQYMAYIPGRLFSVNPGNAQCIDNLFVRNERVITTFYSAIGMISVIFVGAIFVGSVETVWHGRVTPADKREYTCWRYEPGIGFTKGDEIGRFNMGSTVVLLTQSDRINWSELGERVAMGEQIAT